jgi:hypothetical protein
MLITLFSQTNVIFFLNLCRPLVEDENFFSETRISCLNNYCAFKFLSPKKIEYYFSLLFYYIFVLYFYFINKEHAEYMYIFS